MMMKRTTEAEGRDKKNFLCSDPDWIRKCESCHDIGDPYPGGRQKGN